MKNDPSRKDGSRADGLSAGQKWAIGLIAVLTALLVLLGNLLFAKQVGLF